MKFFRKLRLQQVRESRLFTYFLYALGEITLVVIGILIALRINNANADRKQYAQETQMLQEVLADMRAAQVIIDSTKYYNQITLDCLERVIHSLDHDSAFSTDLHRCFYLLVNWQSPFLPFTAYENLKSKGIDLISNRTIKDAINQIYGADLPLLVQDADRTEWVFLQAISFPQYVKHIRKSVGGGEAYPYNFMAMKQDAEFRNWLSILSGIRRNTLEMSSTSSRKLDRSIALIEEELQRRKAL